jgi:hypothetical protein
MSTSRIESLDNPPLPAPAHTPSTQAAASDPSSSDPTPRQRSEAAAASTRSREGYFGDKSAVTESNASGEPRIVLHDQYGQGVQASLAKLSLSEDDVARQLAGCEGRYVGKTVIVTGGARGIGEGCVRVFFHAGSNVVVCDRNEEGGTALMDELNAQCGAGGKRALFVRADVSVMADLEALVAATMARFGRLDCVINNAGWHPPHKTIDDFSVDDMQNLMQLNFVSAFALCKYALPHLRARRGNIINMSSWVGLFGQSKACIYAFLNGYGILLSTSPMPGVHVRRDQGRRRRVHQGARHRRGGAPRARQLGLAGQHLDAAVRRVAHHGGAWRGRATGLTPRASPQVEGGRRRRARPHRGARGGRARAGARADGHHPRVRPPLPVHRGRPHLHDGRRSRAERWRRNRLRS